MNPEIKAQWVANLRSDKYTQGTGWLHYKNTRTGEESHCCLGVLCDMAVEVGVIEREYYEDGCEYLYGPEKDSMVLPQAVMDWAGLTDNNPEWEMEEFDDGERALADLNDSEKWTFEQIADVIERDL